MAINTNSIAGAAGGIADAMSPSLNSVGPSVGSPQAAEFRDALSHAAKPAKSSALDALRAASMAPMHASRPDSLKFSAHAVDRMKSRGISFSPDQMKNIENAVSRAAQKGSRDTLVLTGDNALIVSVKNNTVVTVMDRAAMRENVFTNIDSTVMT
jgi:flagellar operon protein